MSWQTRDRSNCCAVFRTSLVPGWVVRSGCGGRYTIDAMIGPAPATTEADPVMENASEATLVLIARARDGDADALNDLCARYLPRLQRWAHGRLPSGARGAIDTHDLVQETLTHVVQR